MVAIPMAKVSPVMTFSRSGARSAYILSASATFPRCTEISACPNLREDSRMVQEGEDITTCAASSAKSRCPSNPLIRPIIGIDQAGIWCAPTLGPGTVPRITSSILSPLLGLGRIRLAHAPLSLSDPRTRNGWTPMPAPDQKIPWRHPSHP